ncbi:MAG: DUF3098 domain-containing protein [Bacteroidales bacterium]|nr:DUF3098 domain-containing protein [Bacteroidales bacterium]
MENKKAEKPAPNGDMPMVFNRLNYILMGIGLLLLALGYILLSGGGSDDPNVFNDAMFDARRLWVAPILIVAGFVVEIVAIMYKKKA